MYPTLHTLEESVDLTLLRENETFLTLFAII